MTALIAVLTAVLAAAFAGCWWHAERDNRLLRADAADARARLADITAQATGYRAELMRLTAAGRDTRLPSWDDTANAIRTATPDDFRENR